ncbi:lysylphosphatidylglycerol synthase domain-containing protein [Mucilaginibacter sp. RS28]|uniref:Lysylphosphatidylglycerol synthase domain-containing protein n=1 Tax=Mucilaginibacter straminoryzae TaxID=2932774 RepID=A0A9X2B9P4_9SPHI|nr:lysylphosphatidylglycerol synthase domain-containing protein [Mucilaginibacter straminoryzae]MCJ8210869.1 lysylphosphatidylglycerol synthase domain-containing protein [Mucilaginibacter straminoryzae]
MNGTGKKILSWTIKAAILVLAFVFIYHKVTSNQNLAQFKLLLSHIESSTAIAIMGTVFLLMLCNWFLEALKWRFLTRTLTPISIYKAVEAVFCGLTWAVFTPNRLGEYGGRVMFLPPRKRIHGVFSMAVGSIGQMVITNVLGLIAILWFIFRFLHVQLWLYLAAVSLAILVIALLLIFYFNISSLVGVLNSVKFLKKYHRFFSIMNRYRKKELNQIMGFCLARFAVFTFQYYLVLHLLIPDLGLFTICMMVFIMFFIQSILPSLDLFDVGVRNVTATFFFAYVTHQEIAVMAAVSSIWFVNLILPAILGSVFVFKMKFF